MSPLRLRHAGDPGPAQSAFVSGATQQLRPSGPACRDAGSTTTFGGRRSDVGGPCGDATVRAPLRCRPYICGMPTIRASAIGLPRRGDTAAASGPACRDAGSTFGGSGVMAGGRCGDATVRAPLRCRPYICGMPAIRAPRNRPSSWGDTAVASGPARRDAGSTTTFGGRRSDVGGPCGNGTVRAPLRCRPYICGMPVIRAVSQSAFLRLFAGGNA
jgi:hypothetical protein